MPKSREKERPPRRVLAFADLERSKTAVPSGLRSSSEPRLAFNRTVVLWYRICLEQKQYAPTTINLRLAAVRRVAHEAADSGLLNADLAAGIRLWNPGNSIVE